MGAIRGTTRITYPEQIEAQCRLKMAERDRLKRVPGSHWLQDVMLAECDELLDQYLSVRDGVSTAPHA